MRPRDAKVGQQEKVVRRRDRGGHLVRLQRDTARQAGWVQRDRRRGVLDLAHGASLHPFPRPDEARIGATVRAAAHRLSRGADIDGCWSLG